MSFINGWLFFAFIPLFLLYKKYGWQEQTKQFKLLFLSLLFVVLSMTQPVLKSTPQKQNIAAEDYIIALDASYSMSADDLKPTRYDAAKQAIAKLLQLHPKDRFTIFAFTSNALLISPPTTDSLISLEALDALQPQYILTKSTNLYNLFKTVAKLTFKRKKLIIFSDGGDSTEISKLVHILKKNSITPYFVATATTKGSPLKKDGKYLKDNKRSLVISKINPALKDVANLAEGYYYQLSSLDVIEELSEEIKDSTNKQQESVLIQNNKELFWIPLLIALLLFFLAVTKLHQLFGMFLILTLPYGLKASVLDFYYLDKAQERYNTHSYLQAAQNFEKLTPSTQSYYNIATSYYKAKQYKKALFYYSQIQTKNQKLKQALYYNMANAAVHLKKYSYAKKYYIYALTLNPNDKDAAENLALLQKLHLKEQKRPKFSTKEQQQQQKKQNSSPKKTKQSASKSNSNRSTQQSSSGAGGNKKKKQQQGSIKKATKKQNNYTMSYKAYEIINKGYADEKEPW